MIKNGKIYDRRWHCLNRWNQYNDLWDPIWTKCCDFISSPCGDGYLRCPYSQISLDNFISSPCGDGYTPLQIEWCERVPISSHPHAGTDTRWSFRLWYGQWRFHLIPMWGRIMHFYNNPEIKKLRARFGLSQLFFQNKSRRIVYNDVAWMIMLGILMVIERHLSAMYFTSSPCEDGWYSKLSTPVS